MGKLILVIDVGDFLPSAVLDDEASAAEFFNGPWRRKRRGDGMSKLPNSAKTINHPADNACEDERADK
jgi:hypothetical protein